MCYCPTPTLHRNLALTGDGAFLFSLKKTHSVWFISVLNYGDTENVLINHLLLVIPMSYPCHYTNLCPHKPHKHAHTHTHTHTWSSGQPTLQRSGEQLRVRCLRVSPQVGNNSYRSRDSNPQPRVTSLTLSPLEPRLTPEFCACTFTNSQSISILYAWDTVSHNALCTTWPSISSLTANHNTIFNHLFGQFFWSCCQNLRFTMQNIFRAAAFSMQ